LHGRGSSSGEGVESISALWWVEREKTLALPPSDASILKIITYSSPIDIDAVIRFDIIRKHLASQATLVATVNAAGCKLP
jgi:hypothetical protein